MATFIDSSVFKVVSNFPCRNRALYGALFLWGKIIEIRAIKKMGILLFVRGALNSRNDFYNSRNDLYEVVMNKQPLKGYASLKRRSMICKWFQSFPCRFKALFGAL